jgi:phosphotransferase system HPr (HPr) family protein
MMWMMLQWVHAALAVDKARAWPQEQKLGSNHSSRSGAEKAEKEIAIVNRPGLHARPAARFVQAANRFRADVWVEKGSTQVNGKSILGLMELGANCHPLAQSCGACARCLSGPALPDPEATLRRPCDASRVSRNGAAFFQGYGLGGIAERASPREPACRRTQGPSVRPGCATRLRSCNRCRFRLGHRKR